MSASVNIKRGDLHLAVSRAFTLGRYVLMTGGGDGQPVEITIDLRERPDDGFLDWSGPTDDHGPAVPAQTAEGGEFRVWDGERETRVYEFALQDAVYCHPSTTLDTVSMGHVPDAAAAFDADWVHVYDRVTRERRTLKRPAPDAVLTGLRDVAADLRAIDPAPKP